jgi:hypothetical protein
VFVPAPAFASVSNDVDWYLAEVEKDARIAATLVKLRAELDAANEELRARHASDREWQRKAEQAQEKAGALERELDRVKEDRTDITALLRAAEARANEKEH